MRRRKPRLTPELLLSAYLQGVFPMGEGDGTIYWYDPDPRAVMPLDERFHIPRTLRQRLNKGPFEMRLNSDFPAVIRACADRPSTWINAEVIDAYTALHRLGFAHSVESWQDGVLVGGLYGVAVGGLFAGESMFSRVTDASKAALVTLTHHLRERGFVLHDTQFLTPHLARFGAYTLPRSEYKRQLAAAIQHKVTFTPLLDTPSG